MRKTQPSLTKQPITRDELERKLTGMGEDEDFRFLVYTTAGLADFLTEESARLLGRPDRNWLVNVVLSEWREHTVKERERAMAEALGAVAKE